MKQAKGLPVRDDVRFIAYYRPPTEGEIKAGYGAIHRAYFDLEDCCHKGTRIPKKWFVSSYDGLRYYR
jgi:hypothetical protein